MSVATCSNGMGNTTTKSKAAVARIFLLNSQSYTTKYGKYVP